MEIADRIQNAGTVNGCCKIGVKSNVVINYVTQFSRGVTCRLRETNYSRLLTNHHVVLKQIPHLFMSLMTEISAEQLTNFTEHWHNK